MGKITVERCEIEGLCVITPTVFKDDRGYFVETYNQNDFKEAGLDMVFVQDNQSKSSKGVLRGLHFQKEHPQGKLVRVLSGEVYDVAVDLRKNSKTFGKYFGVRLSGTRSSSTYRKVLHMALLYSQMRRCLHTNVQTSIIQMMRVVLYTMTLI